MAYIKLVSPEEATGSLKRFFDRAVKRAGRIWNVVRLMSIKPNALDASMRFYGVLMHGPSKLSRAMREMIAVVVSRANNCYY